MTEETREYIMCGAGGHARVVFEAAAAAGWRCVAVLDADVALEGKRFMDAVEIFPETAHMRRFHRDGVRWAFSAIGDNAARREVAEKLTHVGYEPATIVHPSAIVSPSATIGKGTVLMAGTVVQAKAKLGDGVILNTAASVDHDSRVGDYTHIAPGVRLCGGVTVGDDCLIGVGTSVTPLVAIGDRTTIGAGATVVRDIPGGGMWMGCPARKAN